MQLFNGLERYERWLMFFILSCLAIVVLLFFGDMGARLAGVLGWERWTGVALGVTGSGLGLVVIAQVMKRKGRKQTDQSVSPKTQEPVMNTPSMRDGKTHKCQLVMGVVRQAQLSPGKVTLVIQNQNSKLQEVELKPELFKSLNARDLEGAKVFCGTREETIEDTPFTPPFINICEILHILDGPKADQVATYIYQHSS